MIEVLMRKWPANSAPEIPRPLLYSLPQSSLLNHLMMNAVTTHCMNQRPQNSIIPETFSLTPCPHPPGLTFFPPTFFILREASQPSQQRPGTHTSGPGYREKSISLRFLESSYDVAFLERLIWLDDAW